MHFLVLALAALEGLELVVDVDVVLAREVGHVGGAGYAVGAVAGGALHHQVLRLGLVDRRRRRGGEAEREEGKGETRQGHGRSGTGRIPCIWRQRLVHRKAPDVAG